MAEGPASLRADCAQCFALCCVGLGFTRSAEFPVSKAVGTPCTNLTDSLRCGVHDSLRTSGWTGCVSYDCIGAGQRISQVTFGGRDWRAHPEIADAMFASLPVMRQLHELLAYLADATSRGIAELAEPLARAAARVEAAASSTAETLLRLDVDELRSSIAPLLREVSAAVRTDDRGAEHAGADLTGARLRKIDLRGAQLRGASLLGADLRGAELQRADLIGADLRGADLTAADLTDALYVTQTQLNSALGSAATVIPSRLARPVHWV